MGNQTLKFLDVRTGHVIAIIHDATHAGLLQGEEVMINHIEYYIHTLEAVVKRIDNNVDNCEIVYCVGVRPAITD